MPCSIGFNSVLKICKSVVHRDLTDPKISSLEKKLMFVEERRCFDKMLIHINTKEKVIHKKQTCYKI